MNANTTSPDSSSESHGIARDKGHADAVHDEKVSPSPPTSNFDYDDAEQEPELHARTYFALAAMFLLNLVQVLALQGPPAMVCRFLPLFFLHWSALH